MNRRSAIKIVLLLSACFNLLWIGYVAKVLYCCYGDFTSSMKYGVSDNFLTNWRLLYQKEPWTVYKSSKGVDYGSRFCLNYGDGMVGLYSVVSRDHSTMSVTDIKMVLVAPGYLLSWRYDSDGTCHDVKFKYNGWQMDCEDAIRRCANDKKATGEAHSSQTNANSMTRKVIWTAEASNHPATPYSLDSDIQRLSAKVQKGTPVEDRAQMASDKNQVMDALLNQSVIPADYGERMIALYRDGEQDVLTRDFAVQHIGLYAQALKRRGKYNPESPESASLRRALDDAASETRTIVAAAAFRALSDMSEFDPNIDGHRLDSRLVACISDPGASVAARVVAVQLCGERRIGSARSALAALAADAATPETLRRSAIYASAFIGGK